MNNLALTLFSKLLLNMVSLLCAEQGISSGQFPFTCCKDIL